MSSGMISEALAYRPRRGPSDTSASPESRFVACCVEAIDDQLLNSYRRVGGKTYTSTHDAHSLPSLPSRAAVRRRQRRGHIDIRDARVARGRSFRRQVRHLLTRRWRGELRVACRMSHVVCQKSRARKKRQPPHQVRKLVSLGEMRDEGGERKKRRRRKRRRTFVGMLEPTPPEFVASRGRGPPCLL